MAKSKYSALGLPEYLFQEQSKTSPQISPDATFNPVNAIGGGGGFVSQTAPNQQPKKKEIYLDYKSIFRLWKPEDIALVIAKLKEEGFEVAFIQNLENGEIFTSKIDDSKFKDKEGKSQNIFSLSDDFIKQNFSAQKHETSFEKLKLAIDDSIILNYDQFKEISEILTQEHWVDEKKIDIQSNFAWSFLDGSVDYPANKIHDLKIRDLINHKDFNIKNHDAKEAFYSLLNDAHFSDAFNPNVFYDLDEKKLGDLFDAIPSLNDLIKEGKKEGKNSLQKKTLKDLQKGVLKELWFKHPNFEEGVLKRARTLDEFKDKEPHEIAILLHGDLKNFSDKVVANLSENYSLDISERYPEERNLEICKSLLNNGKLNGTAKAFSILTKHQKENTTFGQKFEVTFTTEDVDENNFIKYKVSGPEGVEEYEESLDRDSFIRLFLDSEINQHFGLTEKFGEAIIANLKEQTEFRTLKFHYPKIAKQLNKDQHFDLTEKLGDALIANLKELPAKESFFAIKSEFESTSFYREIVEQLNENQRKQFLDDLLKKALSLDIDDIIINDIKSYLNRSHFFMPLLSFAQNNLDQPEMKDLAETMLIKLTAKIEKDPLLRSGNKPKNIYQFYQLFFNNLSPEFQDFLIEMDENKKIKLDEIRFHTGEEIYAKFDKDPLSNLDWGSGMDVMPRDIYLKNYKKNFTGLSWDKSKVSSQKIPTSPLQINLFDLNDKTLKKIENAIKNKELDASKILSLKIFGIEREKTDKVEAEVKLLLEKLVDSFPNLKHARVNIEGIEISAFDSLERLSKEKGVVLEKYNSSDPKNKTAANKPQNQFTATNQGDKIYIGDAKGSKAENDGKKSTFSMEESGEIISRKKQTPLKVRDSSNQINPDFAKLEDNLLIEINITPSINLKNCQKNKESFEEQKKKLSSTTSLDQTICSFTRNLEENKKTTLPSISPDNKIIGYYTYPSANITFFKDKKSGFYCAQSDKSCQIHYIIQGRELESRTPTANLDDLPDNVKKILNQHGVTDTNFSVDPADYKIPDFKHKDKNRFLDELFDIENKGACRHRVAALAHRFLQNGLKYDKHFRIIATDGKHVLLEVNKGDEWIALDLGGATANLIEKEGDLGITSQGTTANRIEKKGSLGIRSQVATANLIEKKTTTYKRISTISSTLVDGFKKSSALLGPKKEVNG